MRKGGEDEGREEENRICGGMEGVGWKVGRCGKGDEEVKVW